MAAIETLLFDFGGTLDADGVAWKERFHGLYRAEGLDMTAEAFAPAYYAADDPLVGGLPPTAGLAETVMRWPQTSKANSGARRDRRGRADDDRGRRVASRFLSDTAAIFARNRPVLEALGSGTGWASCRTSTAIWKRFAEFGPGSAVRGDDGQPPGRRREARSGDFPRRSRRASRRARDSSLHRRFPAPRLRGRAARGHGLHLDRARGRQIAAQAERAPDRPRRRRPRLPDLFKVLK